MARRNLVEFQRNTAFALFVVILCGAAFLYVLSALRTLLVPLIWAFFVAIPTLSLAERIESLVSRCFSGCLGVCCGDEQRHCLLATDGARRVERSSSGGIVGGTVEVIHFRHWPGCNKIQVDRDSPESRAAAHALVRQLDFRCSRRCRPPRPTATDAPGGSRSVVCRLAARGRALVYSALLALDRSCVSWLWGQRVRIRTLRRPEKAALTAEEPAMNIARAVYGVNCLVEGRSYYVDRFALSDDNQDSDEGSFRSQVDSVPLVMSLFLDRQRQYPAVLEEPRHHSPRSTALGFSRCPEADVELVESQQSTARSSRAESLTLALADLRNSPTTEEDECWEGTLKLDQGTLLSWLVSMALTLVFLGFMICVVVQLINIGVRAVVQNEGRYQRGVEEFAEDLRNFTKSIISQQEFDRLEKEVHDAMSEYVKELAESALSLLESVGTELFLFVLYLIFWLFEPLPLSREVSQVFKHYLGLKSLVCLLFASIMAALLKCLSCPLWSLYLLLTFILNYIPEVGPFLAGVLMLPAILFDGSLEAKRRYANTMILVIVGVSAKFLTGNIIEVQLYNKFGGDFMRIHPVVIFLVFTFLGYQLGVTGMFVAIPLLAVAKYSLVSQKIPDIYLSPLLVILEGDWNAPQRNYVERRRALLARKKKAQSPLVRASAAPTLILSTEAPLLESDTREPEEAPSSAGGLAAVAPARPGGGSGGGA